MITDVIMKYVALALVILLLVTGGSAWYFYNQFQKEVKANATLHANINELIANQKLKDDDIKLCNSRVDEFSKAANILETKGILAQRQASLLAKKNNDLATQLLLDKQRVSEDSCTAAKRILDEYVETREVR